jgi:hypothetical protein
MYRIRPLFAILRLRVYNIMFMYIERKRVRQLVRGTRVLRSTSTCYSYYHNLTFIMLLTPYRYRVGVLRTPVLWSTWYSYETPACRKRLDAPSLLFATSHVLSPSTWRIRHRRRHFAKSHSVYVRHCLVGQPFEVTPSKTLPHLAPSFETSTQ